VIALTRLAVVARPLVAAALALVGTGTWAVDGAAPAAEAVAVPSAATGESAGPAAVPSVATGEAPDPAVDPPAAVAPVDAVPAMPAPPAPPVARAEPIRLDPPRTTLLPLAQPLWSELTPAQQQVLQPFATQWNALPVTEKRAWADLALRFPKMKAGEQQRVEKRIAEWAALTPDQRRTARANYRLAQQVARNRVLAEWENYQSMTPEQRSVLGTVGTSNTAARHVAAPTGLAKEAAQPLPRRALRFPFAGADGTTVPAAGVAPTVGPAPR
jgi:hypothetical protein